MHNMPDRSPLYLAGALDPATAVAASGVREAAAAVAAIKAALAHPLCPVFDTVRVTVDSTNLCGAAAGHQRAAALIAVLAPLAAAWAAQGLHVHFDWEARSAAAHAALRRTVVRSVPRRSVASRRTRAVCSARSGSVDGRRVGVPRRRHARPPTRRCVCDPGRERHPPGAARGVAWPHDDRRSGGTAGCPVRMDRDLGGARLARGEVALIHPMWSDLGAALAWQSVR